jgi:hypothetical protein
LADFLLADIGPHVNMVSCLHKMISLETILVYYHQCRCSAFLNWKIKHNLDKALALFTNLPTTVELSENRTEGNVFMFGITDPDDDVYSWAISSMVPANDIFYLNGTN